MELKKGNTIKITLDDTYQDSCSDEILWLDYKNLTKVVDVGSKIYIDDGLISLQVKDIGKWRWRLGLKCLGGNAYTLSPLQVRTLSRVRLRTVAPWEVRRE